MKLKTLIAALESFEKAGFNQVSIGLFKIKLCRVIDGTYGDITVEKAKIKN